jgi:hypothetical protein
MNKSDSIVKLTGALLKAQASMGAAVKGSKNPYFKSSYSDYNSVLEVVKEPLNSAGLIVLQPTLVREGKTLVETTIIHAESGEFLSSEMEVVTTKDRDPQAYGSAITYARRYALQSILSIPSVDDDAETAMTRQQRATQEKNNQEKVTAQEKQPSNDVKIAAVKMVNEQPKKSSFKKEPTLDSSIESELNWG